MAPGIHAGAVVDEFLEHANEEQVHADRLAERITQHRRRAGSESGDADGRSHSEYVEGEGLIPDDREDLVAERIAIESYSEMVRYLGDDDPTTRRFARRDPGPGGKPRQRPADLSSASGRSTMSEALA
jgi:bacterioferritin